MKWAPYIMLKGLTIYSVSDFVKLFDFFLQQDKLKALGIDTHKGSILQQVKTILSKAFDAYHSLCTTRKWHVSSKSSGHFNVICWDCEKEGCSAIKFHQPKDQKKMAANSKKSSEQ